MNIALVLKIAEVTGTVLGIAAFALVTYWRLKERSLVREHKLLDNPERCKDHEDRLRTIEGHIAAIDTNIAVIQVRLGLEE